MYEEKPSCDSCDPIRERRRTTATAACRQEAEASRARFAPHARRPAQRPVQAPGPHMLNAACRRTVGCIRIRSTYSPWCAERHRRARCANGKAGGPQRAQVLDAPDADADSVVAVRELHIS